MDEISLEKRIDTHRVDTLDGVRALSVLIVAWFHLWQQSWLSPVLKTPFLKPLGRTAISLDIVPRTGYLFVDMMLLLSAFCLFLPHARTMVLGEPVPRAGEFYRKRAARILPSYYLCILGLFVYAGIAGAYGNVGEALRDLLAHLTFTQTLFPSTLFFTKLNGVLWTVAIEVQFYLLFPLLARLFRKQPVLTYLGMALVAALYNFGFALARPDSVRFTVNQLPAFFGVFANGMLASYAFVLLAKRTPRSRALSIPATLTALLSLVVLSRLLHSAARAQSMQVWQLQYRFPLSLTFTAFLLFSALSARWFRFLLSNRILRFFGTISYNLYIWHQWLAVKLKEWRIPDWTGDQPPNMTGDRAWQWEYTALCVLGAILIATLVTYLWERPAARLLLTKRKTEEPPCAIITE